MHFDPLLQIVSITQNSTCNDCSLVIEMSNYLLGTNISYVSFNSWTDSQVNSFHWPEPEDYRSTILQTALTFVSSFSCRVQIKLGNSDNCQSTTTFLRAIMQSELKDSYAVCRNPWVYELITMLLKRIIFPTNGS